MRSKLAVMLAPVVVAGALVMGSAPADAALRHCNSGEPSGWLGTSDSYVTVIPQLDNGINVDCLLSSGDKDAPKVRGANPVATLQAALNKCNGASLTVDGDYGPKTKAAVVAVQKKYGLGQDGIYGPATRDHMKWYITDTYITGSVVHYSGWFEGD